jgi:hypothetical protein
MTARDFVRARRRLAGAFLAAALAVAPQAGAEPLRFFILGTASLAGTYYAAGRAVCRSINAEGPDALRCSPEPTPGSQYNLRALGAGELEFAFVQSDWQHKAYEGTGPFAGAPMTDLRSVMSLYAEAVTLVARDDAGVLAVEDLAGKAVDLGAPASARRGTTDRVLRGIEVDTAAFGRVAELTSAAVGPELCAGRIDAAFLVIGHPSALVADLLQRCALRLVSLDGPEMRRFVAESADFEAFVIPAGSYGPAPEAVRTVSTLATLVTRADVADDLVDHVARTVIARYDALADQVPALGRRDLARMRKAGLTAPLHPAAAAAFDGAQAGGGE